MCYPKYFDVSYDINPWMSNQLGKVNESMAIDQWNALLDSLTRVAIVKLIEPVDNLPDFVFTANAGFIQGTTFVLSKFSKNQRQHEEQYYKEWFNSNGYTIVQPTVEYEGEGDHLVDMQNRHWVGYGFRTNKLVQEQLNNILGVSVNMVELVDPRWYHLDTAFCPLPNGELLWYPPAFSKISQILIRESFKTTVEIDLKDALAFSCNCICIGNNLFLPKNQNTTSSLENLGYIVKDFELSEFMKAGGAAKCLVLNLENS